MKPKTSSLASKFSRIIAGTMSWGSWGIGFSMDEMISLVHCCLDSGISTFDNADIYGGYTNEADFGIAFSKSGKIRHFGLSNFTPSQVALIQLVGTSRKVRLKQSVNAIKIQLELEDWVELLSAAQGHKIP